MITEDPDEILQTPEEVSAQLKLQPSSLKDMRWRGTGPEYIKLSPGRGGRIRYKKSSVDRWLRDREAGAQ